MGRCVCLSILAILMLFRTSQAQDQNPWGLNRQETFHGVKTITSFLKNTKGCEPGKSKNGCADPVWPVGPSWGGFAPTFTPSASDSSWTGGSEPAAYPPSAAPTTFLMTPPGAIPTQSSADPPTTGTEDTAQPWPTSGSTVMPTQLPLNPPTGGAEDTAQPWPTPGSTVQPTQLLFNPPTGGAEDTAEPWPTPGSTVQPSQLPLNPPTDGAEDTAQPWPTPGSTVQPTQLPLNPPTGGAEDTAQPWSTPESTVQPSQSPLNPPTAPTGGAEDTPQPWPVPDSTGNPTPSPMNPLPTNSPAASPTRSPTSSPTASLISSPTGYPNASPAPSPSGVIEPTIVSPGTIQPTPTSPSGSAGQTPSPMIPTIAPSPQIIPMPSPSINTQNPASPQPIDSNVETQGSVEDESGLVSRCKKGPPSDGPSIVTTTVKYEYVARMTKGAEVVQVLASVEEETHKTFTNELLICDFTRRLLQENPRYTAIYSIPLDEWNPDKACVDAPENQVCYFVNGGATFEYLSGTSASALLDQVGGILTDNYDGGILDDVHEDLLGLDFVSFVEEDDDPAGGSVEDGSNKSATSVSVGGTAAITIAAIGSVVVGILIFRRRRSGPRSVYMEDLGDKGFDDATLDEGDVLEEGFSSHEPPMTTILNDELDDESTYLHLERSYDLAQCDQNMAHDPETCDSPTCAICRELNISMHPFFVDTDADLTVSYSGELPPESLSHTSSEHFYTVPDTVEL